MLRRTVVVLVIILLVAAAQPTLAGQREIPSAATSIADDIVAASKRTVAVVDFTDLQGNVTELGRFVAEEMALGLVTARKGLSVVDRTHLKVLMQENRLDATGVIDPSTARKIGQILGVEALVTGTITPFADNVRIVVKVLDTTTARIVAAASADVSKNRTIEELLARDIQGGTVAATAPAGSASSLSPAATRASGSTTASKNPSAAASNASVFQNGALRISVGQLGVDANAKNAGLSLVVENTSKEATYLALAWNSPFRLTDDLGTGWQLNGPAAGIPQLSNRGDEKESAFALLQGGARMVLTMQFYNPAGSGPKPKTFSISGSAVQFTPAGHRPLAIGIAGITAP